VTFRVSGEDVRETQVTLYRDGQSVRALIRQVGDDRRYIDRHVTSRQIEGLYDRFKRLRLSPLPDDTLYLPAMAIEVWTTGVVAESYFHVRLPSDSTDSAAYWGHRSDRSKSLVAWVRAVTQALHIEYIDGEK